MNLLNSSRVLGSLLLAATIASVSSCTSPESRETTETNQTSPVATTGAPESEDQAALIEELESLGYLGSDESVLVDETANGPVTVYDRDRTWDGLNIYVSGHANAVFLADMEGRVLHTWRKEFAGLWPLLDRYKANEAPLLRRFYAYPDGDLLAIFEGAGIIRLDRASNLLWAIQNNAHHDLEIVGDEIYVLTREAHIVPRVFANTPLLEDYIDILDNDGNRLRRVSLLEAYENSPFRDNLYRLANEETENRTKGDLFHTNTLEIFDGALEHLDPMYAQGNALVSFRNIDTIAIVDMESESIAWEARGIWATQHQPTLLEDGSILFFDNNSRETSSRVIRLDPASGEILWTYEGDPPNSFFSECCGSVQALPNGNILVTSTQRGRAFSLKGQSDQIVWQFENPHFKDANKRYVHYLFDLVRLPYGYFPWLETASPE